MKPWLTDSTLSHSSMTSGGREGGRGGVGRRQSIALVPQELVAAMLGGVSGARGGRVLDLDRRHGKSGDPQPKARSIRESSESIS